MAAIGSAQGRENGGFEDEKPMGPAARRREIVTNVVLLFAVVLCVPLGLCLRELKQKQRDRELIQAIVTHHPAQAVVLLAQGADPNARSVNEPPIPVWKLLRDLVLGRLKSTAPATGKPALLLAVENGEQEVGCTLIQHGVLNINVRGDNGDPIVVMAVAGRMLKLAWVLLDWRAGNRFQGTRERLLLCASEQGYLDIARLMVQRGADVNGGVDVRKDEDPVGDGTPLQMAAKHDQMAIVRLLVERGAAINVNVYVIPSALMAAAENGDDAMVRYLLAHGAKVNLCGKFGSALQYAARAGQLAIVRTLIGAGAYVNDRSNYSTVLQDAAASGSVEVVRTLLAHGAKVDEPGPKSDLTPLIEAAGNGYEAIVKLLLDRGADADHCAGGAGGTALYSAAEAGYTGVVKLLIARGANVNARCPIDDGDAIHMETALSAARQNHHDEIVRLLRRAGARN